MTLRQKQRELRSKLKRRLRLYREDPRGWLAYFRIVRLIPEMRMYYSVAVKSRFDALAKEKGCEDLTELYRLVRRDPAELEQVKSMLTWKGSHFFRGEDWPFFIKTCLAPLAGRKKLRFWCAGCSSGEEVYSLLMALLDYVPAEEIDILATDYNDELLAKCAAGDYGPSNIPEIPEQYLRHMEKRKSHYVMRPELRAAVHTQNLNLLTDPYPSGFDGILCRNVLKFFTFSQIAVCHEKLADSLKEGGFLFLSEDDGHRSNERPANPAALGMEELGGRCIYRKLGKPQAQTEETSRVLE